MAINIYNTPDGYSIESFGTFTFNTTIGVRKETSINSIPTAFYHSGEIVNYTHKIKNGNHLWLSYINVNGKTSYIPYGNVQEGSFFGKDSNDQEPIISNSNNKQFIYITGKFIFDMTSGVRKEPSMNSQSIQYYRKNQIINYDRKLLSYSHWWLSFIDNNQRLYIPYYNTDSHIIFGHDSNNTPTLSIKNNNSDNNRQLITAEQLIKIGWNNVDSYMVKDLNDCLKAFDITSKVRIRHFISQCSEESSGGNYTMELNTTSKYSGGGYLQLTGYNNYSAFAHYIHDSKVISNGRSYVAQKYPWTSAGYYWSSRGINQVCDTYPTVDRITYMVNGGENGLNARKYYYSKCKQYI